MKIATAVITLTLFAETLARDESKLKKHVKRAPDDNRNYGAVPRRPNIFPAHAAEGGFLGKRSNQVQDERKVSSDRGFRRQIGSPSSQPLERQGGGGFGGSGNNGGGIFGAIQGGNSGESGGLLAGINAFQGSNTVGGVDSTQGGSFGDSVSGSAGTGNPQFQGGNDGSEDSSSVSGAGGLSEDNSGLTGGLGGAYGGGYGIGLGGLIFGGPLGPVFAGNTALEGGADGGSDEDDDDQVLPLTKQRPRPATRSQFHSFPNRVPIKANSGSPQGEGTRVIARVPPRFGGISQGVIIPYSSPRQRNLGSSKFQCAPGFAGQIIPNKTNKSGRTHNTSGERGYVAFIFPKTFSRKPKVPNMTSSSQKSGTTVITRAVTYPVPQPVPITINKLDPYIVPVPIRIPVDRPYPVPIPTPYAVTVPRPYPVTVPKPVPVPYNAVVEPVPTHIPVPIAAPIEVPDPYEVDVPVIVRLSDYGGDGDPAYNGNVVGSHLAFQ